MPASERSLFVQGEMSIKEMGVDADATREAGMIKIMTRSNGRTRNAASVVKKDIQRFIAQRLKKIQNNDDKITSSTSSRVSTKNLAKDVKNMSRVFTTVNAQPKNLEEADSDLFDFEDEYEASNFQMEDINFGKSDFQFAQLDEGFLLRIASLFNQTDSRNVGIKTKLD